MTDRAGDWLLRVVPNKYPVVRQASTAGGPRPSPSLRPATGVHEVIIESREHVASFTELTSDQAGEAVIAYRDRLVAWREAQVAPWWLFFKNYGPVAGASLRHVHSQLLGTGEAMPNLANEWERSQRHFANHQQCMFCDAVHAELASGSRIVDATSEFVAFCPFAGRAPFEMCLLPRDHRSHFDRSEDASLASFARFLSSILTRLEQTVPHVSYNLMIHSSPFDTNPNHHYHWHMEIVPRIVNIAGFELGAGMFINPIPPEQAAAELRSTPATPRSCIG